jgi:hypothetical protein
VDAAPKLRPDTISDMATLAVFVIGGTVFGAGIGVIVGYFLGRRHGLRAARRGFAVVPPGGGEGVTR